MELTPSDSGAKRTQNTVFQVTKCIETLESTNIGLKATQRESTGPMKDPNQGKP